ncbi:hypothetical protein QR680_018699 [Steinernema hermaphroditum]|uniref:Nuclear receptor domain-containing protein n=1 Tax=Steinernema hermaphroditum TaxID=289476 RepID=A0AA39HL11_9BILA|nr:hypothetical protein QR680_018699 [Steinernema hermaphroditum]
MGRDVLQLSMLQNKKNFMKPSVDLIRDQRRRRGHEQRSKRFARDLSVAACVLCSAGVLCAARCTPPSRCAPPIGRSPNRRRNASVTITRTMKQDYAGIPCAICHAEADGLHYGAISCRSCNAFFRRAVTFNQVYICRKKNDCDVTEDVRCSCRACRFNKCLKAGMTIAAVQPRRDPTGSQKNRRKPKRTKGGARESPSNSPSSVEVPSPSMKLEAPSSVENEDIYEHSLPSTSASGESVKERERSWREDLTNDDGEEFDRLVQCYGEHQRLMQLALTSIDDFLDEPERGPKMRKMMPTDVEKLSTVELSGLLYWIEKMYPYKFLDEADRKALLKRYSVKKLSLDHFFHASKYKVMIELGNFVMLNNTFVPSSATGFECVGDDERTIKAKFGIFRPTIDRLWRTILYPFARLEMTDAEIVTLHMLMFWSSSNAAHLKPETLQVAKKRREWACHRLMEHYISIGIPNPEVRFGEVMLLLPEIEMICDKHVNDYQIAKLFEFCEDLKKYWYDQLCYNMKNSSPYYV